jgi:hypothetical protein
MKVTSCRRPRLRDLAVKALHRRSFFPFRPDGTRLPLRWIRALSRSVVAGEHTVQQIAGRFSVPRTTVYGHLGDASKGKRPAIHRKPMSPAGASAG